jgi:hypothetical protein
MGPGNPLLLPVTVPLWAGVGCIYGNITKASPKMCALIFAISKIADMAVFASGALIAATTGYGAEISIHRGYAYTSSIVNAVTIVAMHRLGLISQTGIVVLTGLSIIHFISNYNPTPFNDDFEHFKFVYGSLYMGDGSVRE